jgi:AcrR family transcriptional regulator
MEARSKLRSGRVDTEEAQRRRALLLETSYAEFLQHGFTGANLDRIASRCGISKMTIYRQIGDKEALFNLTLSDSVVQITSSYQKIIEEGGSPQETIRNIAQIGRETSSGEAMEMLRLGIAEARRFPGLPTRMLERVEEVMQPLALYLQNILPGSISYEHAMRHAKLFMTMTTGGFLKLLGSPEADTFEWADDAASLFLAGAGIASAPAS